MTQQLQTETMDTSRAPEPSPVSEEIEALGVSMHVSDSTEIVLTGDPTPTDMFFANKPLFQYTTTEAGIFALGFAESAEESETVEGCLMGQALQRLRTSVDGVYVRGILLIIANDAIGQTSTETAERQSTESADTPSNEEIIEAVFVAYTLKQENLTLSDSDVQLLNYKCAGSVKIAKN